MQHPPSSKARLFALITLMVVLTLVQACVHSVLEVRARLLGPGLQHADTAKPTP